MRLRTIGFEESGTRLIVGVLAGAAVLGVVLAFGILIFFER